MVVVEPMVLQMLVVMMLVLAVVMPRRHGSRAPSGAAGRPQLAAMDLWIYSHLNAAASSLALGVGSVDLRGGRHSNAG